MKYILLLVACSYSTTLFAQHSPYLDFEKTIDDHPEKWMKFGNDAYTTGSDTTYKHQGTYSAFIKKTKEESGFGALAYNIPADFGGRLIKLTGHVKTENVTEGYAGLWMRIDPQVGFDNMNRRGITGTTDWTYCEIELALKPEEARQIIVGGILTGTGKMWVDNLSITVDGVPLADAKPRKLLPAEKDTSFSTSSTIKFKNPTEETIQHLDLIGKVWGLLKYHHPSIGAGNYNWDKELFRFLQVYNENIDRDDISKLLVAWIDQYGQIENCESCAEESQNIYIKPDFIWLFNPIISIELKSSLEHIIKNRHQGSHYYIDMNEYVGNPIFKHEASYSDIKYPDDGYRLLTLYRYWNAIQYFFPYRHLIDSDWNDVLYKYIPEFINAKDKLAFELITTKLIGEISDTHANLWGGANAMKRWKGEYFAPFHVRFIEDQLVVVDYFNPELQESSELKVGDIISEINGIAVDELISIKKPYYPASNEPTRLRDIAADLLRSQDSVIQLSYSRDNHSKQKSLKLYQRNKLNMYRWYPKIEKPCHKFVDEEIGYVTLQNIKDEDIPIIKSRYRNTRGIIIDIRNYPSTFVPFSLGTYLLSDSTTFVKFTHGNVNRPGEFSFSKEIAIPGSDNPYKGKVVVLVNELSQSQAEYTTMAFQAGPNTTVIGSMTAGADGNISRLSLPGGMSTIISGIGVYYPDGRETQRIGIVPDIIVHPTISGIRSGEDEVLNAAINFIKN